MRPHRQIDTSQALRRITRTKKLPLHLSFRISDDDNCIPLYLPLLEKFADKWQSIEIIGEQFAHVQSVLKFTARCNLSILQRLTVRNQSITLNYPPPRQPLLLIEAPRLIQLDVSSFLLVHLTPSKTLVDVMLLPCYITIRVLKTLAFSRIETLKFGQCLWDKISPVYTVEFPSLLQLTIDGIPWTTLEDLMQILVVPRLRALDITLELDRHTHIIDLEEAMYLSHHMPCITHLSVTCVRIDGCLDYVNALIFLFGWKFLSVTHFTTNLPTIFLSGLWTGTFDMAKGYCDHGFYLVHNADVPLSIAAIAFPKLVYLHSSADTRLDVYYRSLSWIAYARSAGGFPLVAIMCHLQFLSPYSKAILDDHVQLHDWTGDEV